MDGQTDGRMSCLFSVNCCTSLTGTRRILVGQMDGRTDRWMDGQTDGWMDRQMDGCPVYLVLTVVRHLLVHAGYS